MAIYRYVFFLTFILFFSSIQAKEPAKEVKPELKMVSLPFLIQKTFGSYQDIPIQYQQYQQSKAVEEQLKTTLYPQASLSFLEQYQDQQSFKPDYKLSVSYTLFNGFRYQDAIAIQTYRVQDQEIALKQVKRNLIASLIPLYFSHLQLQKQLQNIQDTLQLSLSRLSELNRRVAIGKSRKSEVLMAESQYALLKAKYDQIEGDLLVCKQTLYRLSSIPVTEYEVSDIPLLTTAFSTGQIDQRPEFLSLTLEKKIIETQLQMVDNAFLPSLSFNAQYYFNRPETLKNITWDTGLFLTFPFYQGGIEKDKRRELEAFLLQNDLKTKKIKQTVLNNLATYELSIKTASKRANRLTEAYQKAKNSYQIYQEEYRLGLVSNLDVLQALSNLLDTKLSLDQALIDQQKYQVGLQFEKQEMYFDF